MERETRPNSFFKVTASFWVAMTLCSANAQGQEGSIGKLGNIIGKAEIIRSGKNISAAKGMDVFTTDVLVTSQKTAVKIQFIDGSTFMAFENASIKIEEYKVQANGNSVSLKSAINVVKGKVRFFVKPKPNGSNDSTFRTPNAVMGIRGTSGFIDTTVPGKTQLVVLTGKVEIRNPQAPQTPVLVGANQMTDVVGKQNPTLPKEAPANLLSNLNSDASNVDQGRPPSQGSDSQKEPGDGKGEEKKDDAKKDDASPEKKDSGDAPKKSDEAPPSRTENKDSPPSNQQQSANGQGEKPSGLSQDGNSQAAAPKESKQDAAPPPPSAKPAPVNVERKTVFTPEGTTVVSVKDQNLQSMTVPVANGIGPVSSQLSSKTQAAGGESAAPVARPIEAYKPPDVLREVSKVTDVNKTVEQAVTTITQPVQQAVKQETLPEKKNVRIKITLPQ